MLSFYDAISEGTPHLYISALPLAPQKSMIAERMWPLFPNMFKVTEGADEHWSACLRTISLGGKLISATFSPDGHLIATSCSGVIQLWDAKTGESVSSALESNPGGLAFTHDSRLLFCRHHRGGIQVWDTKTLELVPMTLPATSPYSSVIAISYNNQLAVTSPNDHVITVWDLRSSTTAFELVGHSQDAKSIAFSPNGRLIASASNDMSMRIWDADTGVALFDQSNSAKSVAFSPDSRYIVCGCWNKVEIWDSSTYTQKMELHLSDIDAAAPVAFSPSGGSVVFGFGDSMRIWDLDATAAPAKLLLGHIDVVNSVMFSPNGQFVISGSFDGSVRIWDTGICTTMAPTHDGHSAWVNQVIFSPDDRHVLSAADDNAVGTWDVNTGRAVCDPIIGPTGSSCLSVSPNCQRIITKSEEGIFIWNISSRTLTAPSGTENYYSALAFSSDSLRLASAHFKNNTLQVHDIITGAELLAPTATGQYLIESVAYSPCARFIASGDSDGENKCTVCIWNAETGDIIGEPIQGGNDSISSLAFSPDGLLIAVGSYRSMKVYEVETGTLVHDIISFGESIIALAFSPNGRRMATGSFESTIRIWDMDLDTPTSVVLRGHINRVRSVAFSHDGSLISSGSDDCTVRIWDAVNIDATINASLNCLTSALYHATNSSPNPPSSVSQDAAKHSETSNLKLSTSHLAHRLTTGGWVSLTEGSVFIWLLPEYRVIDDSSVQVSARHISRPSIDFSQFVHGDQWMCVADGSVRRHPLAV